MSVTGRQHSQSLQLSRGDTNTEMAWSNCKPNVPELFKQIIVNQKTRVELKASPVVSLRAFKINKSEGLRLRFKAQDFLKWNPNDNHAH